MFAIARFNIESKNEIDSSGEVHTKFQVDFKNILNEKRGKKNIVSNNAM